MSKLGDIRTALLARLAVPNGSAPYTYDLSVTGRVLWGGGVPVDAPDVVVVLAPDAPIRATRETLIGQWKYVSTYTLLAIAPAGEDTPGARYTAAAALMEDLARALLGDPGLTYSGSELVWDIDTLELDTVDDQELDASGAAVVVGRISISWGGDPL